MKIFTKKLIKQFLSVIFLTLPEQVYNICYFIILTYLGNLNNALTTNEDCVNKEYLNH